MSTRAERIAALPKLAEERIIILDGAMGTMIQRHKPTEADYRGERFAKWNQDLKGNNDLLSMTRPDIIKGIHRDYLAAGADVLGTNTFSSTTIAQADYAMESIAREMNVVGARIAREVADQWEEETGEMKYVAGAMGPTNRTASISPDVNNPGFRAVSFDELKDSYREAAEGLVEGGADILIVETIFDTLNAKAALFSIEEMFDDMGEKLPIIISGTITDASGRTLSGQTTEAFYNSLRHVKPFAIGLNCAMGADQLRQYVAEMGRVAECYVSAYPNAGLPNEFGEYDQTEDEMAALVGEWCDSGLVNFLGGCCGTTPPHIREIVKRARAGKPRKLPERAKVMRLSGLEPFEAAE